MPATDPPKVLTQYTHSEKNGDELPCGKLTERVNHLFSASSPNPGYNSTFRQPWEGDAVDPENESPAILDGGFRAWSQVLVSFLLVVNGFGYLASFGLFQSYWMNKFEHSASSISWVGSI